MSELGIGAMIHMLFGTNEESVAAFKAALGKKIAAIKVHESSEGDGGLLLTFDDGSALRLYDEARSCCESRYMKSDDDLEPFIGSTLQNAEVKETAFLVVTTSLGQFTVASYNEHNGYYGGILIRAAAVQP